MTLLSKTCKICKDGKPYGRLDVHIRHNHQMNTEEYAKYDTEAGEIVEFQPSEPIKPVDVINNIFDGKTKETHVEQPLKVFLKEFELTEKELRAIVTNYKTGKPLPMQHIQKLNEQKGIEEANKLKEHKGIVTTTNLYTAEALTKYHGFRCIAVKSAQNTHPKVWELIKD